MAEQFIEFGELLARIEDPTTPPVACERCGELLREYNALSNALFEANKDAVDAHKLLHEISLSGVEHDDPRLRYVTVQIDRETWNELQRVVGTRRAT